MEYPDFVKIKIAKKFHMQIAMVEYKAVTSDFEWVGANRGWWSWIMLDSKKIIEGPCWEWGVPRFWGLGCPWWQHLHTCGARVVDVLVGNTITRAGESGQVVAPEFDEP